MDETIYGVFKVQFDFALEVWFSIDSVTHFVGIARKNEHYDDS